MAIKNLEEAALRLNRAVERQESIILYGDADLDGVTSAVIMQETLRSLGGNVERVYFPDREKDGYGITEKALGELKLLAPALLLAMDLGISNFKEIAQAKKLGFDVVVVDHHVVLDNLPPADIVVDPKQEGDTHPFKELAACGLTFRLAEAVLQDRMSPALRKNLVELAALGTIADMMPREADNSEIIEEGMEGLESSWRPGIAAFFALPDVASLENTASKAQKMISILNVRDVEDGYPASFRILSCDSEAEAGLIARKLMVIHQKRKERTQRILDEMRNEVSGKKDLPIVFEGGEDVDYILLGILSSVLSQEEEKPAFIYRQMEDESVGSVRAPSGIDTVEAMKHCRNYAITYGGHPQASGFRVKNENREKFKTCLVEYFNKRHG